jgi:uncharacterized protein (DUF983 family)
MKNIYWKFRSAMSLDPDRCPRCKDNAFRHGFEPNVRKYCWNCGLWIDKAKTQV